jgi:ribosomal protein S18 acetylase RimI-like enzyme
MPHVISLHDKATIRHFALRQPLRYLYEIGDLDDFFWPYTQWYGWLDGKEITQLALLYIPFDDPVLLTHANPQRDDHGAFVTALLRLLPARIYAHIDADAATAVKVHYQATHHGHYHKMGLSDASKAAHADDGRAEMLSIADIPALERLYATAYPGNWFDARMVQTGFYAGIRDGDALLAAAGIHVVSERERVAALGNVTTLPELRGQGLAQSTCACLIGNLHQHGITHIGLNVSANNPAAIALYQRLGFTRVAEYDEYTFVRG